MALNQLVDSSGFALEMQGIGKSFGPIKALEDVTLRVSPGTVHALVGENGAGKSTLMKILSGVLQPDTGTIVQDGKACVWKHPSDSLAAGVAMIYQELSLAPDLTIAENVWLGIEPRGALPGTYSKKRMLADTRALAVRHGFDVDPDQKVQNLPASTCQIVEVLKALARNAEILVMDEPTSSCGEAEVAVLLEMVKKLSQSGTTIIYISHRLEEVVEIAEDITVLRDGRVVHTGPMKDLRIPDIVKHMVGRDLKDYYPKKAVEAGATALRVSGLSSQAVENISFDLRWGEIVGIAGLVGAGRTDLARVLCGLEPSIRGRIEFDGKSVSIATPVDAFSLGIMYVTEDRKRTGLCLDLPAAWNMTLPCLAELGMRYILHRSRENAIAEETGKKLALKWSGPEAPASALSGGNQQKLLLGRALIAQSRLWVLDEPTRGIDIAAKVDIYELIGRMAAEGKAILIISSELPELFGITDRILVMRRGRLVADLVTSETTQEAVMQLAAVDKGRS
ncbi:sugar ABC transporter ATP-binding protein [Desulfomonile tiedjei]|uniref:Monosaccharide ABC transporter ATP-binding protein, CUT2 family n=1 Tax=Desulfomonile tiedjei (strain ATCC 49306 / DSM 6799 / DCB-1) TaxID=706587 RepID=I4C1C4_DESTA|nr:sugar ABC transporter ATP-binding protein [Desulfomonile tiedjei]AFM23365.1 monosaccharide ABC transporter ATP-binding protein, CUT2 family [Desulfomonile tiedjei DSM 6799]